MRILHFIPERTDNSDVRKEYFRHLMKMADSVELRIITTDSNTKIDIAEKMPKILPLLGKKAGKIMDEFHPDILHIHGCTGKYEHKIFNVAQKHRIPVIVSPLGDLAAITLTERSAVKRLTSTASRARTMLWNADAIHVTGELELDTIRKMQLIPDKDMNKDVGKRIFMIKNSVLTNSITAEIMCQYFVNLYKKISFLRAYDVMLPDTKRCEKILLRFGNAKHYAKISDEENKLIKNLNEEELNKIFIHAEKENVREIIDLGCKEFGIPFTPDRKTCRERAGIDDNENEEEKPVFTDLDKIRSKYKKDLRTFENYQDETDLFCLIASSHNLIQKGCLTYRHLAEICNTLIKTNYNEDVAQKMFKDMKFYDYAARLMYIMNDYMGLPEGFMPLAPINDKKTEETNNLLTLKSR